MAVERQIGGIEAETVDVVEQQPHPNAASGGGDDLADQQPPGKVVLPVIVLQVEAAAGQPGRFQPCPEGLYICGQQLEAAHLRMGVNFGSKAAVEFRCIQGGCKTV